MRGDLNDLSSYRVPRLTVIVLTVVAASIALANLSSEPVSGDHIKSMADGPHRAYGWPLTSYWRVASPVPGTIKRWGSLSTRPVLQWPLARYSASRLTANVAIWLLLLAVAAAASRRPLGRYRFRWRPRWTTLVVLLAFATPLVLANMSFEKDMRLLTWRPGATIKASFGWPLIWNWYFVAPFDDIYWWDFSAVRLAGNIVIWLVTLVLLALAWEWLLRRYRPRWHFSLRTMMVAVALVCVLCAWSVMVRKRANEQDALAESLGSVRVERWGPKWLGMIVPDRFRRRVVGVSVHLGRSPWEEAQEGDAEDAVDVQRQPDEASGKMDDKESDAYDEETPKDEDRRDDEISARLGRLSSLRSLHISCGRLTPATADALANLRQLRALGLDRDDGWRGEPPDIAWLGKLHQLEYVSLTDVRSDELAFLTGLTYLNSLALNLSDCAGNDQPEMDRRLAVIGKLTWLRRVRLEGSPRMQIAHLANLTNLESLSVEFDRFPGDEDRLRQCFAAIGKMTQLEQLDLTSSPEPQGGGVRSLQVCADDLACLRGLANLKSLTLHISCDKAESHDCLAALGQLTQLRRLRLDGDLVSGGVIELAPLASLEELTGDHWMATPTAIESLSALKNLRAVHIAALDRDFARTTAESDHLRRVVRSLRQSRPRLVIDGNSHDRRLEEYHQYFPWFRGEPFDDGSQDLEAFLGFVPVGP
ncbi:MAG TPA: hypothetical protein VHC22_15970 [Pirellulales bacterium]|nr:hypothetical protein [Pirellulales bacterium]